MPSTTGVGPAYVTGTHSYPRIERGTATHVGDVLQLRGNSVGTIDTMNDPRVTGTGTILGDADMYGTVGPQWGRIGWRTRAEHGRAPGPAC